MGWPESGEPVSIMVMCGVSQPSASISNLARWRVVDMRWEVGLGGRDLGGRGGRRGR